MAPTKLVIWDPCCLTLPEIQNVEHMESPEHDGGVEKSMTLR